MEYYQPKSLPVQAEQWRASPGQRERLVAAGLVASEGALDPASGALRLKGGGRPLQLLDYLVCTANGFLSMSPSEFANAYEPVRPSEEAVDGGYVPPAHELARLGLALEMPKDVENPHPAWVEGTRKYVQTDGEGNRRVVQVQPQYGNLLWIYTTSAHSQSTSTKFLGVCHSARMFHDIVTNF